MGDSPTPEEFRIVIDRAFSIMSLDPDMGPKLRDADTPQRFDFPDVDLVVNIASADPDAANGHCLVWEWSDDAPWEPIVEMTMNSDVANRYFQGRENVSLAIARRRIKTSGNIKKALALLPITKPVFPQYRAMLEREFPHLLA